MPDSARSAWKTVACLRLFQGLDVDGPRRYAPSVGRVKYKGEGEKEETETKSKHKVKKVKE